MFAYIKIINDEMKSTYSYVNFEISKDSLSIRPLKGALPSSLTKIQISQITDIQESDYLGWKQISFNYNDEKYVFVYSGYGGNDYLREHLLTLINA